MRIPSETVLCIVRANSNGTGISILNFDINVAHRGVESPRTGVWWNFSFSGFRGRSTRALSAVCSLCLTYQIVRDNCRGRRDISSRMSNRSAEIGLIDLRIFP